ncbi:MAG: hypothetical protein ACPGXL_00825, partial [Chitinophagales bacterium]
MSQSKQNNYDLLITKLDQFIRKYYINNLIKGTLYAVGLILLTYLAVTTLAGSVVLSSSVRAALWFGSLVVSGLALLFWVLIPLLQLFKLGRVISHEQAATIIGNHFSNVKDKLLNILQLKEQSKQYDDTSLIEASIDQKIDDIKIVPFSSAIDLGKNREYVKYAALPILLLFGLLWLAPSLLEKGTDRIVKYSEPIEEVAPFKFTVENEVLEVVQYEDLMVNINVDGEVLPNEAFIHVNNFPYKLSKTSPSELYYKFNKIQKETSFYMQADGFR